MINNKSQQPSAQQPAQDAAEAKRYRWLRAKAPERIAAIAWSVPAAAEHGDPDEAIDAAIAATGQPAQDDQQKEQR